MPTMPMHQASTIAGPPPLTHRRCRQRFRDFIIASLFIIVGSLVASAPTTSASTIPEPKCIEIKEDYDLRNAARDSNLFLIVHEKDDKKARESICNKLETTPKQRLTDAHEKSQGALFAYLEIKDGSEDHNGEWQEGNSKFVKNALGLKKYPSFLFVSKGMDGRSKYSSHITHYKGSEDPLELSDEEIFKFVENKVGFRLGNDVYNIIFFDSIASRFVSYGDASGVDYCKQRFLALLVRLATMFSYKEPFSTIGTLYNRAFSMSFEHGIGYSEKQVDKLQKRLESNKGNISVDKIHEFRQKIAILKAFAEPKKLTAEDDKQIFIHALLHLGLVIATILLFMFPGDDAETAEDIGEEEVINAEPVIAKAVDDDKVSKKKR